MIRHTKRMELDFEQVRKKWTKEKTASYGRIKKSIIGGFVMPRKYRHIKDDEKELIDIKQGTVPCFTLFCLKFNSSAN